MIEYQFFEVNDFLEDEAFRQWVFHPQPADVHFWQTWLDNHPGKQATVAQARQLLLNIRGEQLPLTDAHIDDKVAQLLVALRQQEATARPQPTLIRSLRQRWYYAAAAVVLLGVGLIGYYQFRAQPSIYIRQVARATTPLQEVINDNDRPESVTLPDGSVVTLYKNSRLSYPRAFAGNQRDVYLTGEAFFQVEKDPTKPFLVYANELVTRVLGTSFAVKAYDQDKHVSVSVKTGKVSVFTQETAQQKASATSHELAGLILLPNQQATLERTDKRLTKSLVAQPQPVDVPVANQEVRFRNTPVTEVFARLEKDYGVDIVFDETLLTNCTLTATLSNEPLFKKLEWICAGTESSYTVIDGQILITGKGCN
ncbi:FecR family protein [Spirosoma sp. KUDC1026]|uniref:FecR family protein n=1 Tax=Spirosoma sp. KUDC1026 TaxID=2745947 RepID=UPI00159BDC95|nr:FecR family protein [Spirosoma sp. KUDC1026]QKZ11212.1 FecR family protein [Spirosoma sp. KUDC1026]